MQSRIICSMVEMVAKNCMSLLYSLQVQDRTPDTDNIMGRQILKCKCACRRSRFVKNTWERLSKKMRRATH